MGDSQKTRIFTFIGLIILIIFTLTVIIEDPYLRVEGKSHSLKAFEAFYFIGFIAFLVALALYIAIVATGDLRLLEIGLIVALIVGCVCCIISVIMYFEHFNHYRRPDSSSWLIAVILSSFQLCLFVFLHIIF
ncbi:hypothetical protein EWB00_009070 [Schistosoma japonicum]|uniref:Uncharacterized protein n=1 Tax=Schistosoma japonicum TaxID=6182 RepID=A0A4Z2DS10_SCHJA|nr:hypothetical protein KSF78_0002755 [Schistosoma japonicum]KAH8863625.1 hypothetical protein KSF78_0002755 [Schistosoma japonicum]TNN19341.1 hypothetical protein EWB00_009070 [Schistosoma japonicum]TNN19342.1 hypothetical protein EWB00_009070 [Schistosoma japonicum]